MEVRGIVCIGGKCGVCMKQFANGSDSCNVLAVLGLGLTWGLL